MLSICLSAIQEIEAIKARVKEMEEEAEKLKEMQTEVEKQMSTKSGQEGSTSPDNLYSRWLPSGPQYPTPEEKAEMDSRSVYVGNVSLSSHFFNFQCVSETLFDFWWQVDYQSTAEELGQHFQACGSINRVTILCDKYTGSPKG